MRRRRSPRPLPHTVGGADTTAERTGGGREGEEGGEVLTTPRLPQPLLLRLVASCTGQWMTGLPQRMRSRTGRMAVGVEEGVGGPGIRRTNRAVHV